MFKKFRRHGGYFYVLIDEGRRRGLQGDVIWRQGPQEKRGHWGITLTWNEQVRGPNITTATQLHVLDEQARLR